MEQEILVRGNKVDMSKLQRAVGWPGPLCLLSFGLLSWQAASVSDPSRAAENNVLKYGTQKRRTLGFKLSQKKHNGVQSPPPQW